MTTISSSQFGLATATTTTRRTSAGSAPASRTVNDVADLSQTARLAENIRTSPATGRELAQQLSQALADNKAVTETFAAKLGQAQGTASREDLRTANRAVVADILREGKPANFWERLGARLFKG